MEGKARKLLEETARQLNKSWVETGAKDPKTKFFGGFTKKEMSTILWVLLILGIIANAGIYYQLLTN